MNHQTHIPDENLTEIVRQYWTLEGNVPDLNKYIHRTMANFCPELIFHYGGQFKEIIQDNVVQTTFTTGIHGQTDRIRRLTTTDNYGIFGVILQPYAIPLLLGVSSLEIKNQLIDLPSILGLEGVLLSEQILGAKDTIARIQIVNNFLKRRLKTYKRPEIIQAAHFICKNKGIVDVKQTARQSFLSQRQFERNFKELIGFSPKSFVRLVRFKSLANNYRKGNKSLTQVAYDFGYYDQSHFIQEFKSFSGYNPNTYFSGGASEIFYAPSKNDDFFQF